MKKDFSTEVIEKGRHILEHTECKYLGKICRVDVTEKVKTLSGMVTVMMDHLKKDKNFDPVLEKAIRHLVATCMDKGTSVGKRYNGTPEELMKTILFIPIHPNDIIANIPKGKRKLAKYILQSLLIGKLSYETGLAISATLTKSQRAKYLQGLEDETVKYIW